MIDVALVTNRAAPALQDDDRPLAAALAARGLVWQAVPWDAPDFDWAAARLALLRSPWDYHLRRDEFLAWAARVAAVSRLVNPLPVVRWNTHKGYLAQLATRGVPVIPTVHLAAGSPRPLADVLAEAGWRRAVVKPAVSADSWETFRVDARPSPADAARHAALVAARDMLVQEYLPSVEEGGERCLVVIDGAVTHAVRKRSLFQGGRHAGPEGVTVAVAADEARTAHAALEAAGFGALPYARVDVARAADGRPLLMELELCEPTLFFGHGPPDAAERLAARLVQGQ